MPHAQLALTTNVVAHSGACLGILAAMAVNPAMLCSRLVFSGFPPYSHYPCNSLPHLCAHVLAYQ
eukprot:8939282-Alexandrium_andersonii.AAC.1